MYELALKIATEAHKGQVDKAGKDYIEHPKAVAAMLRNEGEKTVALLHDVIEDTNITTQDLSNFGFSDQIVEAVDILTKRKGTIYAEYLSRVKENSLARVVKIADIKHNSDLSRLSMITEKDMKRKEKYEKALKYLVI